MFKSFAKVAVVGTFAAGLLVCGAWLCASRTALGLSPAAPAEAKVVELPTTRAPVQVLASLDQDNKLTIKTNVQLPDAVGIGVVRAGAIRVGAGGAPVATPILPPTILGEVRARTYNLDAVEVFDTQGKLLDKKEVMKRLKKETLAVASLEGEKVEALHFRVLKEGTLVFVLPAPAGAAAELPPGRPLPPGAPGGFIPVPGPGQP